MTIFQELKSKTQKHVKNYISDFDIDQKTIEQNKGIKFIHITREHGTSLTILHPRKDYPAKGENAKYLFHKAGAKEILEGHQISFYHYLENEPKSIYFFNGEKLIKCNQTKALEIYRQYYNNMINTLEAENTKNPVI